MSKKKDIPKLWVKYPDIYPDIVSIFRKIKNKIIKCDDKVLFILTGSDRQVGVSTIAFNLSLVCGFDMPDLRILLIDANVLNPSLHKVFSIESNLGLGLTDLLYGKAIIDEILHKTEMKNFDLIPIGTGCNNMSSPFTRALFFDFIEKIKNIYNMVFIDTEPILHSEYTQSIAPYTDGVIVISEAEKTKLNDIKKTYAMIKEYNINYIGNILNRKKYMIIDKYGL